jgi:hypothetical protein
MNNLFLTTVYEQLDLQSGSLLSALSLPNDEKTKEAWLNKGDWLELATKIGGKGAEKVFFVKDEPVIVFYQLDNPTPSDDELKNIILKAWCMSRPQRLFIALPTELRVYDLTHLPVNKETQQLEKPLKTVEQIADVLEKLKEYKREQLESGYLPKPEKRFGQRADKQLIQDLKLVREELEDAGLKLEYAHALISRAIFVRYLEDRGILTKEYFIKVAADNANWQELLEQQPEKSAFNFNNEKHFFCQVLQNKEFTYALFDRLEKDFNGDLFPQDKSEENHVEQKHLNLLRGFLLGDTEKQQKIFFHLYDFKIVPIELISNIYEEFYHTTKEDDSKGTGSHYTPSVLAEFVLSEVLTPERLKTNPTVLDPACGSGIFLVEAFRRIVRFNINDKGRSLNAIELREILKNQIRGIEINKNAIEITAFSLYLALLHYQNPPDILAQIKMVAPSDKPLPYLIYNPNNTIREDYYNNLFNKNSFEPTPEVTYFYDLNRLTLSNIQKLEIAKYAGAGTESYIEQNSIDIVVGNPPWGFVSKNASDTIKQSQNQVKSWCKIFDWTIGDNELSQAFIARSLSFLKENTGEAALLVSTGVFLKRHKNSQLFRSKWLSQTTVKKVVNFAHVRHAFFSAISPFAFVHYQNKPASSSHRVQHWSAKKTETIENNQAVVLYNSDIRQIKQYDLINNEQLWKVYWWGGHRDASLINILKLEKTLVNFIDKDEKERFIIGQGFKEKCSNGKIFSSDWLNKYKELPIENFQRYNSINYSYLKNVPLKVHQFGNRALYEGWRLLIKRGITQKNGANGRINTRLEDKTFCFRHSIHGVKLNNLADWQRKIIVAIFWSSLARYYLFMTSGSWGMWHHETQLSEIENFPIRLLVSNDLKGKIISIVDKLRNFESQLLDNDEEIKELENQLDKAVFELYELSEAEQDLVLDMCETGLEFFYKEDKSNAVKPFIKIKNTHGLIKDLPQNRSQEKGLEGYLYAFLDFWNDELNPDGEFNWTIISLPNNPMLAVIFTTQNKGELLPELQNNITAWDAVLNRCGKALKREISRNIYIEGMMRSVSDTEIIIIKRNERRLWTRTAAREDAEATLAQAIRLQEQA